MNDLATIPDLLGTSPADLIDRVADQPVATLDQARQRAERVRAGLDSYTRMRQDIADAYACRDWLALGYETWFAYLEGEYGPELRRLTRDERPAAVRDLRTQGMSTRQIAAATGVDARTVRRDLGQVGHDAPPAAVTGTDGKTYAATRPTTGHPPATGEADAQLAAGGTASEATTVASVAAGDNSPTGPAPAPVAELPREPDRSGPPPWDPEERRQHEENVRRIQAIDAAQRSAGRIVGDLQTAVLTIIAGYRYGETDLVTPDTIRELRAVIDTLEAEL